MTGMRMRLEFHDEPGGRTRLELRRGPYPPAADMKSQARAGWESSLTRLDGLLAPLG